MHRNPYELSGFEPGARVYVHNHAAPEHAEGPGSVESVDSSSVYVRVDADGEVVAAAPEQCELLKAA